MSWLTRAIMNVLGFVVFLIGTFITLGMGIMVVFMLTHGITEEIWDAVGGLIIALIVMHVGALMMPWFRAKYINRPEDIEKGERWAEQHIRPQLEKIDAKFDALEEKNIRTFRNQLAAIEREATLPWYKRSFFKDTRKKYILKELAKLEAQKMAAAHEEIRTASLDVQMKAVHIDSVSDDEWNAHMKKTAELAAEGQKII